MSPRRCPFGVAASVSAALLLLGAAGASAQSSGQEVAPLRLEVTTERIRLYTSIATATGQAANRAADMGLDKAFGRPEGRGKSAVAQRIVRGYLVNVPIAFASHFAAHEMGHLSRLQELGGSTAGARIGARLWPFPHLENEWGNRRGRPGTLSEELSVTIGGFDAAGLQERMLVEQIYSGEAANYFNWLLLLHAKLDLPVYTWFSRMSLARRPVAVDAWAVGDPRQYALGFGRLRARVNHGDVDIFPHVGEVADAISRGVWLNLADYALIAAVVRSAGYLRTGERISPNPTLRIGGLSVVPSARFLLTPAGLETGGEAMFVGSRNLFRVDVRSTETASRERLWGTGFEMNPRLGTGWAPQFRGDVFQRRAGPFDSLTGLRTGPRRLGARVEAGAHGPLHIGGHILDVGIRVGYKTEGYFADAPERRTLLGGVSAGIRF